MVVVLVVVVMVMVVVVVVRSGPGERQAEEMERQGGLAAGSASVRLLCGQVYLRVDGIGRYANSPMSSQGGMY